ncbi:MAG TPA: DUF2254 domain-containing protein [Solirubrobacteraceae bacterium]|jgi:uncharacterized membrane protein|nr:DUF2254 domain-containing protein [Solirubrobacteraceae bacterium]
MKLLAPPLPSAWRREALRTNLWLVPTGEIVLAVALFAGTHALDRAAYNGSLHLPSWVISGTADAARQILTAIAAAVITVVTLVFSITIVTLTLASTQFGPRMLRNFIRDRVTQLTLGSFVATFVYAILALVSIGPGAHGEFVPHLSITVTMALVVADVAVLVVFIDHIAKSIQLPQVIASIAGDLSRAIDAERKLPAVETLKAGPSLAEMLVRLDDDSGVVRAPSSGYLQYVSVSTLIDISSRSHAVIRLLHRPGHFVVEGEPLANVWPAAAAPGVARALGGAHATGPHRTLTQDLSFAVDQLVEIAIRALSPAVNDTFTALACIDWLGDGLGKIAARWRPVTVHRDSAGHVRVITVTASFRRLVERAHDKIRQASRGMPAVMIRQLEGLTKVMAHTTSEQQRELLLEQATMILRSCEESVSEESDRADVRRHYDAVRAAESAGAG